MATASKNKHVKPDYSAVNQGLTILHPDPDQSRKSSSDKISVDIIAVPGLGANPEWTWKSKNKVDWLRDGNMLSQTITNARIMVFEYESQWFGKGSINQRINIVALQLVQALTILRSKGPKPPIVFICHSLGGIVVEQALLTAKLHQTNNPDVYPFIVGCVFLGTPFRGTKSQSKATVLAKLAEHIGVGKNSGLLKLLEEDSEGLRDLLHDFSTLASESHMMTSCFFEQHESDLVKFKVSLVSQKEILVGEGSATLDWAKKNALAADHFELNKFTGPKDGRYISVSGEINNIVHKGQGILKCRQNAMRQFLIDDATYQTILDSLRATDPTKDMQDCVAGRPASQASWVLNNEAFVKWRDEDKHSVLWIHGNPGKGQPVIASSLIQELEKRAKDETVFLAYFFCDEKDAHRRTILNVLKVLIRQLILKRRDLTEHLLDSSKGTRSDRKSQGLDAVTMPNLWKGLQSMLKDPSVGTVYFVINGFDETDGETRKEFLKLLAPYIEPEPKEEGREESAVKWNFLGRPRRRDIEKGLHGALVIDMEEKVNADLVDDGVKMEISDQVDKLAGQKLFNAGLKYFIKKHIYAKAEGNYIYVHLMIQELKNLDSTQTSISTVRKFLEEFPLGLTNMFAHIRRRVLNPELEGIEYTKEIFRCLLLAEEAPTVFELAIMADLPDEERNDELALRRCISRCGAFVTVSETDNKTVEWIDMTAKEHLEANAQEELSLVLNDVQHGIIALRCFEYVCNAAAAQSESQAQAEVSVEHGGSDLEAPDQENTAFGEQVQPSVGIDTNFPAKLDQVDVRKGYEHGQPTDQSTRDQEDDEQAEDADDEDDASTSETAEAAMELLYYPSQYWLVHAKQAPPDLVKEFDLDQEFWSEDSAGRAAWWKVYGENEFDDLSGLAPLHIAAMSGYCTLVDYLLENGHTDEIDKSDSWGFSPLTWACRDGERTLVQQLLKAGANVNYQRSNDESTPLLVAMSWNNVDIVEDLLERGADINVQVESWGTPLYGAVEIDSTQMVRKLLELGANVNLTGGLHRRPINIAAFNGNTEIVQLLLGNKVDVDPDDEYFHGSALGAAARGGHVGIIRQLLGKGWNVNRKFKTNHSALFVAAKYGQVEAVQALMERNIDIISQEEALDIASKKGRSEVVIKILEAGANLRHEEAFHSAAFYGRNDILTLLQKRGITPELLSRALYDASDQERKETVDLLLNFGASPDAEGEGYGNALIAAAFDGSVGIVKSLLEKGASVNKQHEVYGNALQVAASSGNVEIAKLLLDCGAHLNTKSIGTYGNVLQAACYSGNETLVDLLIKHGANVNTLGGQYNFPIIAAADEGHAGIVEILVNHGADVNVRGVEDNSPLFVIAGYVLNKESMEFLLNHGANIEATNDHNTTALIATANSGDPEGLTMLLDRGANIHASGDEFGTALHAAASQGDEECCKILIQRGAQVNQRSGPWDTALQAAAFAADLDCIELLLEAGADVHASGGGGTYGSALQAAAFSGDQNCLQKLLEVGAKVNQTGGYYGSALQAAANAGRQECLDALLIAGANVNLAGGKYGSALQAAATRGRYDIVRTLLKKGANVNQEGGKFGTALQAAAFSNDPQLVKLLVEHHADAHIEGGIYGNALNAAARRGYMDVLPLLLDRALADDTLDRALLQAVYYRQADAVETLLQNGASVEARDPMLGSALDALQREAPDDSNSDDMGDYDDEDEGDEDADVGGDADEENEEEKGDDAASVALTNETDTESVVARNQLEARNENESQIRKLLVDALVRIRQNPGVTRFRPVTLVTQQVQRNNQVSESKNQLSARGVDSNDFASPKPQNHLSGNLQSESTAPSNVHPRQTTQTVGSAPPVNNHYQNTVPMNARPAYSNHQDASATQSGQATGYRPWGASASQGPGSASMDYRSAATPRGRSSNGSFQHTSTPQTSNRINNPSQAYSDGGQGPTNHNTYNYQNSHYGRSDPAVSQAAHQEAFDNRVHAGQTYNTPPYQNQYVNSTQVSNSTNDHHQVYWGTQTQSSQRNDHQCHYDSTAQPWATEPTLGSRHGYQNDATTKSSYQETRNGQYQRLSPPQPSTLGYVVSEDKVSANNPQGFSEEDQTQDDDAQELEEDDDSDGEQSEPSPTEQNSPTESSEEGGQADDDIPELPDGQQTSDDGEEHVHPKHSAYKPSAEQSQQSYHAYNPGRTAYDNPSSSTYNPSTHNPQPSPYIPPASTYNPPPPTAHTGMNENTNELDFKRLQDKATKFSSSFSKLWK